MRLKLFLIILLTAFSTSSVASQNGHFYVLGIGTSSCGSWVAERKRNSILSDAYVSWAQGYITSFNEWTEGVDNVASDTDSDGIAAAIDNYCTTHPLKKISEAVEDVVWQLFQPKIDAMMKGGEADVKAARKWLNKKP